MAEIHVPRTGPGRLRTTPDHVIADKGYSSRKIPRLPAQTRNPPHDPRTQGPGRRLTTTRAHRRTTARPSSRSLQFCSGSEL
jgi:hypothetical protein